MNKLWTRRRILQATGALALVPVLPRRTLAQLPELVGATMGTYYRIRVQRVPADVYLPKLKHAIERVLDTTDTQMSTYRASSELCRFNRTATRRWQDLPTRTSWVLQTALRVRHESNGAFEPAAGPLIDHWGFGPKPAADDKARLQVPSELLRRVAGAGIELKAGRVRKHHKQAALDLSAIAKGDALDGVAEVLERAAVTDYLVEVGGEIRARGAGPLGDGWRIGLDHPNGGLHCVIKLDGKAIATSGDYVHYFMHHGRRYCHIIDPRTGRPVEHGLSMVAVVADSALEADAWATALLVMGPKHGVRHAMHNAMSALFLQRVGSELVEVATLGFQRLRLNQKEVAL